MRTLLALILACATAAAAAPKPELWPAFAVHDANSTTRIDHSPWDTFLAAYVKPAPDGIHRVAYGAVDTEARLRLSVYLSDLQRTEVNKLNRAEQRAYWINFYNAATIKLVLDRYPLASILDIDISPGLFAKGPWGARRYKAIGENLSLDDMEHRILRPIWNDPRTHYAVNCASLGCPNLATRAYTAANMEALLDEGARAYVNHRRGARVENGKLIVSSIYEWFRSDFGGDDAGVIEHLKRYAAPELAAKLAGVREISDDGYDWSLNDQRSANTTPGGETR